MVETLLLFTPVLVCAFWAFIHLLIASRTDQFLTLFFLMMVAATYLFTDACYANLRATDETLVKTGLLAQLVAPCLIPLACIYLKRLKRDEKPHPFMLLWIVAPVTLFTAAMLLSYLAGQTNIERFTRELYSIGLGAATPYRGSVMYVYFIFTAIVFRSVLAIEMLWMVIRVWLYAHSEHFDIRHIPRFFKGHRTSVLELQVFNIGLIALVMSPKLFLSKSFIDQHSWLMVIIAILATLAISNFCYTALFSSKRAVHIKDMYTSMRFNYRRSRRSEVIRKMVSAMIEDMDEEDLHIVQNKIAENLSIEVWRAAREKAIGSAIGKDIFHNMATSTYGSDSLIARFQHLMTDEQLYLDPRLGLEDVAVRLHSIRAQ